MRKLSEFYDQAVFWAWDNPAKMSALITLPGDALMLLSGIGMQNWGRVLAGGVGVVSQLPIVLYGDAEATDGQKIEDPQDVKTGIFRKTYNAILNPRKYPFEFYSYVNLLQTVLMCTVSGPAVATGAHGEHARPGETFLGATSAAAFGIMLLREDEEDFATEPVKEKLSRKNCLKKIWDAVTTPVKDLREAFNFCSDYALHVQAFGVRQAFDNACDEISKRGPNQVAAKIIDYSLIPYAAEAVVVHDYYTLAAAGIYYASNIFLRESSKRVYKPQLPCSTAQHPPLDLAHS